MSLAAFLSIHPVFTRGEFVAAHAAASEATGDRAADKALDYAVRTGRVVRVKRGLYVSVPLGSAPDSLAVDPLLVGSRFAPDAVLSHHSALELHGLAQSVLWTHTVTTNHNVRRTRFRGVEYMGVKPPKALVAAGRQDEHVMTANRSGLDVRVTDLERTVVDALDRLELSGGWEEVMRSLDHVRVLDAEAACDYALLLDQAATAAKLGLFLDVHREELLVEQAVLDRLKAVAPRHVYRIERGTAQSFRTVPRWRLSVPEGLFDPAWAELK